MAKKKKNKKISAPPIGLVIFLVCGALGSCGLCLYFSLNLFTALNSSGWVKTPCRMISCNVTYRHSDKTSYYVVDVAYEYSYKEKAYISSNFGFSNQSPTENHNGQKISELFAAGKNAECFVNPDKPSQAVLVKKTSLRMWASPVIMLIVTLAFISFTYSGIKAIIKKRKTE